MKDLLACLNVLPQHNWIKALPKQAMVCLFGEALRDMFIGAPPKDYDYLVSGVEAYHLELAGLAREPHSLIQRYQSLENPLDKVFLSPFTHNQGKLQNYTLENGDLQNNILKKNILESMEKMLKGRDLTIHAVGFDMNTRTLLDPTCLGVDDLKYKIIRMVREDVCHDPDFLFRLLRLKHSLVRFGFIVDPYTLQKTVERNQKMGFGACDIFSLTKQIEMIQDSPYYSDILQDFIKHGFTQDWFKSKQRVLKFYLQKQIDRLTPILSSNL